jgi:hypothetical protein
VAHSELPSLLGSLYADPTEDAVKEFLRYALIAGGGTSKCEWNGLLRIISPSMLVSCVR